MAHLDPADGPPLLLGPTSGPSTAETTVRTGGPGFMPRLVGFGLALVALVLIWGLFRQPSSEVAPEPAGDGSAADTAIDDTGDGADDDPEADDDPAERDAADEERAEEIGEEGVDGPTTTGPRGRDSTSSDASGQRVPTPPLLGQETGLSLVSSREGRADLQILDLDSGELTELERTQGRPVGAMGSLLVLSSESTGRSRFIDLRDPEAEPIPLSTRDGSYLEVVEVTDDRVWTLIEGPDGLELQGFDASGEVVEQLDLPVFGGFGFGPWSLIRASALVYDPAGGLYRRDGDGFDRIAEGQVLAVGERLAVIRQCDETLECQLRWYELRSSGLVGFPAPPPSDGDGVYYLLGGDRWLFYYDWRSDEGRLIEVATAREVRRVSSEFFWGVRAPIAVSEDGRWLVDVVDGMLVVVDLDDGTEWPTGLRGAGRQTLFIDTTS